MIKLTKDMFTCTPLEEVRASANKVIKQRGSCAGISCWNCFAERPVHYTEKLCISPDNYKLPNESGSEYMMRLAKTFLELTRHVTKIDLTE